MLQSYTLNFFTEELKHKNIFITQDSFAKFEDLFIKHEYEQDVHKISMLSLEDPLLALKLMLKIEKIKKTNLHFDVDSMQKGILLLGIKSVFDEILNSSVCIPDIYFAQCIRRAKIASSLSYQFSILRKDINPEEICLNALLGDLGELLLWLYYPEIPLKVKKDLESKKYSRNREAQFKNYGFYFNDLSINLIRDWNLPKPILGMMTSNGDVRSMIAKSSINISRHLCAENGYLAIPDDIRILKKLLPGVSYESIFAHISLEDFFSKNQIDYILRYF